MANRVTHMQGSAAAINASQMAAQHNLFGILVDVVGLITAPVTGLGKRRHAYSALMSMDDRQLEDIGLGRGDISQAVYGKAPTTLTGKLAAFGKLVAAPVIDMVRRAQAFGSLMALDDRMLEDIGLNRGDVARAVYGDDETGLIGKLITKIKQANDRRAALRALEGLSDHLLADIGFQRTTIEAQLAGDLLHEQDKIAGRGQGVLAPLGPKTPFHPVAAQIARIDLGLRSESIGQVEANDKAPARDKIAA